MFLMRNVDDGPGAALRLAEARGIAYSTTDATMSEL